MPACCAPTSPVVLPISIPSFVVVIIWQFLRLERFSLRPLLRRRPNEAGDVGAQRARSRIDHGRLRRVDGGALLASVPTLIVYIALGKYFVGGLMSAR